MAAALSSSLVSRGGLVADVAAAAPAGKDPKVWAAAQDFEAVFLNTMFAQMFAGLDSDGPFGGSQGTATWRGLLTEEWSRSISSAGGVGLADHVYRDIIALQEKRS